jgi:hypothetical protein
MTSTEVCLEGGSFQDLSGKTMAPWTFDVKFSRGTQFTFGSLTFAVGEDGDLKMVPQGSQQSTWLWLPHLHQTVPTQVWILVQRSTSKPPRLFRVSRSWRPSSGPLSGIEFIFIGINPWLRFISRLPRDWDQRLRGVCGRRSSYPHGGPEQGSVAQQLQQISHNRKIRGIWCPDAKRRLSPKFESRLQCMAPDGSPLAVLAQQGAEVASLIIAEKSAGVPRREPSVGDNDQARRAQSEAASSASPNYHLYEHDVWWRITQNCVVCDYSRDRDDLRNVIENQRRLRLKTPSCHTPVLKSTELKPLYLCPGCLMTHIATIW